MDAIRKRRTASVRQTAHLLLGLVTCIVLLAPREPLGAEEAKRDALRFCVCPSAMPRSGRTQDGTAEGVDIAVAKWLAHSLGRACEFHWCATDSCRLRGLKERRCDVVIGLPQDSAASPATISTIPYASGAFGLVVRHDDRTLLSLADLRGKRVGIVTGTIPLSTKDYDVVRFPTRDVLLRAFGQSDLDGAFVDADFAEWYLKRYSTHSLRVVKEFISQYRWNVCMAVRATDTPLRQEIARAIDGGLRGAKFQPLFAKYGLVFRPPLSPPEKAPAISDTWQKLKSGQALVVSMDPDNLPYSSADEKTPGFDVEIAHMLARELDTRLRIKWIDVQRETAIGSLLEYDSDLAFGAAVDPHAMEDEQSLTGKVTYSRPYYGTGYFLLARDGAQPLKSLSDLRGDKSRRLGAQAGTIADYSLRQRGYLRQLFGTQKAVLDSLQNGTLDYAYLWSNVGWILHRAPEIKASIVPDYVPDDRWNIAIVMRQGEIRFKAQVDRALERIMQRGLVTRALEKYHMPYFPPFSDLQNAYSEPLQDQLSAHRPRVDRGLEPRMSRRHVSRHGYRGLERIRQRGSIVVGLDQNNLPFSTAHPGPTGLDYDVAQLLAKELGVSLRVYWAYSSHDSYPSKLAEKKLCDVVLGVTPDDRFADRVAYSKPYYFANYVYAVSCDDDPDDVHPARSIEEPVAAEAGLAVTGLLGRSPWTRTYPSLEAILSDVATNRIRAGYVISTRASWLAAQKWPEKIRFFASGSNVDRFPVCIAMGRDDLELRDTVNTVIENLRSSGQLQSVFARWHVPMDSMPAADKSLN